MSNCTNKPASSLVAGTFIGKDCEGNEMGAGGTFASCNDLNNVKQGNTQELNNIRQIAQDAKTTASNAASDASDASDAASNAASDASDALQEAQNASGTAGDALQTAQTALGKAIVRVNADGDKRDIILEDGTEIPFYITDTPQPPVTYNDQKVVGFGVEGDNIVITMLDGTKHDMTRQEFADWLSAQDSSLATDEELADAIANGTGNIQDQLDALQDQLNAINTDQATLSIVDNNLVLRNEDGTTHSVSLLELLKVSPDDGNEIELRDNGLYIGQEAAPDLANLYIDDEHGNDANDGSINNPLRTIDEALRRLPRDKSSTIHLRAVNDAGARMVHSVGSLRTYGIATRKFVSYDQPVVTRELINCFKQADRYRDIFDTRAKEWVRPLIRFTWKEYNNQQTLNYWRTHDQSAVEVRGVNLEITPPSLGDLSVRFRAIFLYYMNLIMYDADFEQPDNDAVTVLYIGSATSEANLTSSKAEFITDAETVRPMIITGGGRLNLSVSDDVSNTLPASQEQMDACGVQLTPKDVNMRAMLQQPSFISGISRDDSGTIININSNFEL